MANRTYVPAMRAEPDLNDLWGLYCVETDLWMPVTFRAEREALEAAKVVNRQAR